MALASHASARRWDMGPKAELTGLITQCHLGRHDCDRRRPKKNNKKKKHYFSVMAFFLFHNFTARQYLCNRT